MNRIDLVLLLMRVSAGLMIAMHGYAHIYKKGKLAINGTAAWFGSMGMRPPLVQAWLASLTELGAAASLVLGLFTSLGAAGLLGVMLVAWIIAHRKNGFFIYNAGQGWEYVAMLSALSIAVGTLGPGKYSLDHALDLDWYSSSMGFWVTMAGAVGAVLLLVTCWRPPAAKAK